MGQRSQIYIRYNGKLIVANYYQWNYGERMISRARYILERLYESCKHPRYWFEEEYRIETLRRYCDVNFDFKDIQRSDDIVKEYIDEATSDANFFGTKANEYIFDMQDNNDGQLFIDIRTDFVDEEGVEYAKEPVIKYAFRDSCFIGPFNAEEYWSQYKETADLDEDMLKTNSDNIEYIMQYPLMTEEEMIEFVEGEI